jgi:hypothetical protein
MSGNQSAGFVRLMVICHSVTLAALCGGGHCAAERIRDRRNECLVASLLITAALENIQFVQATTSSSHLLSFFVLGWVFKF